MNLLLHGIGTADGDSLIEVRDALIADPGERWSVVLSNPPFGRKSSLTMVGADGREVREDREIERQDFVVTTSNKQLNFVQHIMTILDINGRAAVVLPDNVLFEGGAGETLRRKLLRRLRPAHDAAAADRHLLRPGREGQRAVLRQEAGVRAAVDHEAVGLRPAHQPALHAQAEPAAPSPPRRVRRRATCPARPATSGSSPSGGSRSRYDELIARDKVNLDITWLRDESLEDVDNLPAPEIIAREIVEDLTAALAEFEAVAAALEAGASSTATDPN